MIHFFHSTNIYQFLTLCWMLFNQCNAKAICGGMRPTGSRALLCYSFNGQVIPNEWDSAHSCQMCTLDHMNCKSLSALIFCKYYCFFDDLEDLGSVSSPEL